MEALKLYPRDHTKRSAGTAPRRPAREAPPESPGEDAFRLPASFVSRLIEGARARALDREYLNGVLAAFHYLRSPAGEKEALELLERRRQDR